MATRDMLFKDDFNLEKPIFSTAEHLEAMIAKLSVGEGLMFVKDISDKENVKKWIGVKCIRIFDRDFYIVARYSDGFYNIWDCYDPDLIDKIVSLLWNRREKKVDDVFVFEENDRDAKAYMHPNGSLCIYGYTDFGADIILPIVDDIVEEVEVFRAKEDIKQKLLSAGNENAKRIKYEDICKMAETVVSTKNCCDAIKECYLGIIDGVIKGYLSALSEGGA